MEERFCRTCQEFVPTSYDHNKHLRCSRCKRTTVDKIALVPINAEVNEMIARCTKSQGQSSLEVLRAALELYIVVRGIK